MNEAEMHKKDIERVKLEQRDWIDMILKGDLSTEDLIAESWFAGYEYSKNEET